MKNILMMAVVLALQPLAFGAEAAKEEKVYKFIGQEYEPFNWTEADKFKGGMYDVVKKACEKMKIKCSFESIPMKRVIAMLEDGSTDGVMSLLKNPDREAYSVISTPIISSNMSYFGVKGKFKNIKKLEELKGSTVGAVQTSTAEKIALVHKEELKDFTVVGETGLPIVMSKLAAGRYGDKGLAISNEDVFKTAAKKEKITNLEEVFVAKTDGFGVAFSKKAVDQAFIDKFNATIEKMKKSGELKKILKPFGLKAEK
jgi:polar amino acid transport system substrate-binding protein